MGVWLMHAVTPLQVCVAPVLVGPAEGPRLQHDHVHATGEAGRMGAAAAGLGGMHDAVFRGGDALEHQ